MEWENDPEMFWLQRTNNAMMPLVRKTAQNLKQQ